MAAYAVVLTCLVMILGTIFSTTSTRSAGEANENTRSFNNSSMASAVATASNGQILTRALLLDPPLLASIKQAVNYNNHSDSVLLNSLQELIAQANSFLLLKPTSVIEKSETPASGDKHDFLSLAPYRWPDPTTPNGLPYVNHDGRVNPEVYSIPDKKNLDDMIYRAKILALAYYFTDNSDYASKATELLRVWFLNNGTKMHPNLQHAEVMRGKNNGTMNGIMHGKNLPDVIDVIRLIQYSPSWSKEDQQGMEQWFNNYLDWLLQSNHGKEERLQVTNHGTWYASQVSSIATFLNKTHLAKAVLSNVRDGLLAQQIGADGSQRQEISRTNSLDYSIFNLLGIFKLASLGQHLGVDIWNFKTQEGSGLQKALDYLLPSILNQQTWPHSQGKPISVKNVVDMLCRAAYHYENNQRYAEACKSASEQDINTTITFPP